MDYISDLIEVAYERGGEIREDLPKEFVKKNHKSFICKFTSDSKF